MAGEGSGAAPPVMFVVGRIGPPDLPRLSARLRRFAGHPTGSIVCDVAGLRDPDLGTIDTLARLAIVARRLGWRLRLRRASSDLAALIALAGLGSVLLGGLRGPAGGCAEPAC